MPGRVDVVSEETMVLKPLWNFIDEEFPPNENSLLSIDEHTKGLTELDIEIFKKTTFRRIQEGNYLNEVPVFHTVSPNEII